MYAVACRVGRPWESNIFSGEPRLGGELVRERVRWAGMMECSEVVGEGRGGSTCIVRCLSSVPLGNNRGKLVLFH